MNNIDLFLGEIVNLNRVYLNYYNPNGDPTGVFDISGVPEASAGARNTTFTTWIEFDVEPALLHFFRSGTGSWPLFFKRLLTHHSLSGLTRVYN